MNDEKELVPLGYFASSTFNFLYFLFYSVRTTLKKITLNMIIMHTQILLITLSLPELGY